MTDWNPWHGCHKISPGCLNCYVYRRDSDNHIDSSIVRKTAAFGLPLQKSRNGEYKIKAGEYVWTCFTSDFFLEEADPWRAQAWEMMRIRRDLTFMFITKRIARFKEALPHDWGEGYENVEICCTAEDQKRADQRIPIFLELPIRHKTIVCEPLLDRIDLSRYLDRRLNGGVSVGGESGPGARVCDYDWVLDIRRQCMEAHVPFSFHQTGARLKKDGRIYWIPRNKQHTQAKKANIDYLCEF